MSWHAVVVQGLTVPFTPSPANRQPVLLLLDVVISAMEVIEVLGTAVVVGGAGTHKEYH